MARFAINDAMMKPQARIIIDNLPFWQCPRCRVKIYPPEGQKTHERWHVRQDQWIRRWDWHGIKKNGPSIAN